MLSSQPTCLSPKSYAPSLRGTCLVSWWNLSFSRVLSNCFGRSSALKLSCVYIQPERDRAALYLRYQSSVSPVHVPQLSILILTFSGGGPPKTRHVVSTTGPPACTARATKHTLASPYSTVLYYDRSRYYCTCTARHHTASRRARLSAWRRLHADHTRAPAGSSSGERST